METPKKTQISLQTDLLLKVRLSKGFSTLSSFE